MISDELKRNAGETTSSLVAAARICFDPDSLAEGIGLCLKAWCMWDAKFERLRVRPLRLKSVVDSTF